MPVIIPVDLPATETLKQEFIPVMHEERARHPGHSSAAYWAVEPDAKKDCYGNAVSAADREHAAAGGY